MRTRDNDVKQPLAPGGDWCVGIRCARSGLHGMGMGHVSAIELFHYGGPAIIIAALYAFNWKIRKPARAVSQTKYTMAECFDLKA